MIETILAAIVNAAIPQEYMPLVIILLVALLGIEQWLASTKRIKANSTLQLIVNVVTKILKKNNPALPTIPPTQNDSVVAPDDVPDRK